MSTDLKIFEAELRIKQLDEVLVILNQRRKKISDWLEKQNPKELSIHEAEKAAMEEKPSREFEDFWIMYPSREGMKREKKAAWIMYRKLIKRSATNGQLIYKAATNYARSSEARRGFARDAVRFLKEDFWPEWVSPTEAMMVQREDKKAPAVKSNVDQAVDKAVSRAK